MGRNVLKVTIVWKQVRTIKRIISFFQHLQHVIYLSTACLWCEFFWHTHKRVAWYRVHTKNCNHFSRTFQGLFKDFSRTTLDFQGQPTRNIIACEQAFVERGIREREKRKGLWTSLWDRRSTAPAVHQILMQVLIGENTDCWKVWLTSAFRSARNTRLEITKHSKDC